MTLRDGTLANGGFEIITIWNVETGQVVRTLKGHTNWVRCLKELSNGNLASGSADNKIKIWNTRRDKPLRVLKGHTDTVLTLEQLRNTERLMLASGSLDATIKIWDIDNDGQLLKSIKMSSSIYQIVRLNNDVSNLLAINCLELNELIIVNVDETEENFRRIKCGGFERMVLLGDGSLAIGDVNITVWDVRNGELMRTLRGHKETIWSLQLTHDGSSLASGSKDGEIRIWNLMKNNDNDGDDCWGQFKAHDKTVSSMAILNDGSLVSGSNWCKEINVWK